MKKLLAGILSIFMMFGMIGCQGKSATEASKETAENKVTNDAISTTPSNGTNETEASTLDSTFPSPPTDEGLSPADFSSYESILITYEKMIELCWAHGDDVYHNNLYLDAFSIPGDAEKKILEKLFAAVHLFNTGSDLYFHSIESAEAFGYVKKDLNQDQIDELILMREDGYLLAIFSMHSGKPVLLDTFTPSRLCWLDEKGLLHINFKQYEYASNGNSIENRFNLIYGIAQGGGCLTFLTGAKYSYHYFSKATIYTKLTDSNQEKGIIMTRSEFDNFEQQFPFLSQYDIAQTTKSNIGYAFDSMLTYSKEERALLSYQAVLREKMRVTHISRDTTSLLGNLSFANVKSKLWEEKNDLTYALVDLDGDGIREMLLKGSGMFLFYFYNNRVFCLDFPYTGGDFTVLEDGTFSWQSENGAQKGLSRLTFIAESDYSIKVKIKNIYQIFFQNESNLIFVDNKSATQATLDEYLQRNPLAESLTFSPAEVSFTPSDRILYLNEEYPDAKG